MPTKNKSESSSENSSNEQVKITRTPKALAESTNKSPEPKSQLVEHTVAIPKLQADYIDPPKPSADTPTRKPQKFEKTVVIPGLANEPYAGSKEPTNTPSSGKATTSANTSPGTSNRAITHAGRAHRNDPTRRRSKAHTSSVHWTFWMTLLVIAIILALIALLYY